MKKLFLITLLFMCFSIGAQELEWNRDLELEEFFYSWDLDVEVWRSLDNNGYRTINIEDVLSENWFDVRSTISTVLYSINDEAEYQGITANELDFDILVYSWFEDDLLKYESEDDRWDFYIDIEWLDTYFNSKRDKDKTLMVSNLLDVSIIKWEDLNLEVLKRDVEQIDSIVIEQQIQSDSIELRPSN